MNALRLACRTGGKQPGGVPGAMGEADDTFRLASGVFYEPPKLESAVADLHANGFTRRDMCLAGTREALSGIIRPGADFPVVGGTLDYRRVRPLYPLVDNAEVVASNGILLRKLLRQANWRLGERELSSSWLLPDLFSRFSEHMRKNAVVLLVSAGDSNLQHRSSRILLKHSAHTVQTHEFTPMRPPEPF